MQAHESQAKRCKNHFHQPQFAPLAHVPPAFTLAALTPCWSSVYAGSIPALDGKFFKEESCALQRITAGPFNASTAKMLLTGKDFGLGWTAGVSTSPDQQPVLGLLFLSKQEARDSARATLQAMTPAWEEQWLKCTMCHDTSPLTISDTLEASTGPGRSSSSRRKGFTPLLQPWCGSRNRRSTSPSIGSRSW